MIDISPHHFSRMIPSHPVLLMSSRVGRHNTLAPVTWYAPQSIDPPMIAVSLKPSSASCRYARQSGDFILGIPGPNLLKTVHFCGMHSGRDLDKMRHLTVSATRGKNASPLAVQECLANIECRIRDVVTIGNRPLLCAEVISIQANPRMYDNGWLPHVRLIHHEEGHVYRIGNERVNMEHVRPGYVPPDAIE